MKRKLIPYKILFLLVLLVLIILVFKDVIYTQLTFNINASDLAGRGEEVKWNIVNSLISLDPLLYRFNVWQSILFPLLITVTVSQYLFMKKRFIKNYIGKNDGILYTKEVLNAKLYFAKINMLGFVIIFILIVVAAFFLGKFEIVNLGNHFHKDNFLAQIINTEWTYLIYFCIIKVTGVFSLSMFAYYLADYFNNFIHSALSFLIILWLMTPILHHFLPFYLVPLVSLMITSFNQLHSWQLATPHIVIWTIIFLLKKIKQYEVD